MTLFIGELRYIRSGLSDIKTPRCLHEAFFLLHTHCLLREPKDHEH